MKKSSIIALGAVGLLSVLLVITYLGTRSGPEQITKEEAVTMLNTMKSAVEKKSVGVIMDAIAPSADGKYADMTREQLRMTLARAFQGSGDLTPDFKKITFDGGNQAATLSFDISVKNTQGGMSADDYKGHITLYLKRVEVPCLLGAFKAMDWRITKAESTGPNLSTFGEF